MYKKIGRFFTFNLAAIILAVLFGFIILLPTILVIKEVGFKNFKGLYPVFNDDEVHYLAIAKEVSEGHGLGNAFIGEYKNRPPLQPSLINYFIKLEADILNKSIPFVFALNDFLLPVIAYLILYSLFLLITKSRARSNIFSSIFFLLFINTIGRPVSLQLNGIFLFVGIIVIWQIFKNEAEKSRVIILNVILGVVTGLLVYMYPYYWTALVVLYGLMVLFYLLFERNKKYLLYSVNFFISFVLMIIPYIVSNLKASASPYYSETISRLGLLSNHWPACYSNAFIIFLPLALVFLYRKNIKSNNEIYFPLALLLGGLVLNWSNVITGKYLQFSSHYYQVTILFILLSLAVLSNYIDEAREQKTCIKIVYATIFIILVALLLNKHKSEVLAKINFTRPVATECSNTSQGLMDLYSWMNLNTESDSSLYAIGYADTDFAIYTHNNLFFNGYAGYYLMSDEEMEERWIVSNYFEKIDEEMIKNQSRVIWLNKFIDEYQNKSIRNKLLSKIGLVEKENYVLVPDEYVDRVMQKTREIKNNDLVSLLKKYKTDYVVINNCQGEGNTELEYFQKNKQVVLGKIVGDSYVFKIVYD